MWNVWEEKKLHISTDSVVTLWMLCVIPDSHNDAKDNSDSDNRKQSNNVIKTLLHGLSEDEMDFNLDLFWIEYTDFDNNNG